MFTSVDTLGYMLMICLLGHTTLISFMKYIGIFYKIRNKLPMVILKKYLLCICTSAYFVWHWNLWKFNTSNVHLKKLTTLNNKLLRILQNKPNKFPVKYLYLNFDTLAIPDLHTRQLLILVHKVLHHPHLLPTAFANYFTSNSTIHQHNTRKKENLHLTSVSN